MSVERFAFYTTEFGGVKKENGCHCLKSYARSSLASHFLPERSRDEEIDLDRCKEVSFGVGGKLQENQNDYAV